MGKVFYQVQLLLKFKNHLSILKPYQRQRTQIGISLIATTTIVASFDKNVEYIVANTVIWMRGVQTTLNTWRSEKHVRNKRTTCRNSPRALSTISKKMRLGHHKLRWGKCHSIQISKPTNFQAHKFSSLREVCVGQKICTSHQFFSLLSWTMLTYFLDSCFKILFIFLACIIEHSHHVNI